MTATIYIIKDGDAYRFGWTPAVQLWEPESVSRTWIRRATVELPDGFYVAESVSEGPMVYRDNECYDLSANQNGEPVLIDHKAYGASIPLTILSEGWD